MTLDVSIQNRFGTFALDVSFVAPTGITALYGRSGAGKTTVVNAIAGLLRPDAGRIHVAGETLFDSAQHINVPTHKRRIGYVFQDARLFPHLNVRQNLLYGNWFSRRSAQSAELERTVDLLGIEHLLARRPGNLSGGERQRTAIGRALLSDPRLLLMDEPLAALDVARKADILPYLERLRDELQIPIIYVSHAVPEVARLATTIVALDHGKVVRQGAAAQVLADPDAFPLMGRQEAGAILPATVVGHDTRDQLSELSISGGKLHVPLVSAPPGSELRVRIRARDVMLALNAPDEISALNVLPATVQQVGRTDGGIVDVSVRCGGDDVLARITRRSLNALALTPGKTCFVVLKSIAVTRRDISAHASD